MRQTLALPAVDTHMAIYLNSRMMAGHPSEESGAERGSRPVRNLGLTSECRRRSNIC